MVGKDQMWDLEGLRPWLPRYLEANTWDSVGDHLLQQLRQLFMLIPAISSACKALINVKG